MQEALAGAGLAPVELRPKEGLALINGTLATTGLGVLALLAAERAAETADAKRIRRRIATRYWTAWPPTWTRPSLACGTRRGRGKRSRAGW